MMMMMAVMMMTVFPFLVASTRRPLLRVDNVRNGAGRRRPGDRNRRLQVGCRRAPTAFLDAAADASTGAFARGAASILPTYVCRNADKIEPQATHSQLMSDGQVRLG